MRPKKHLGQNFLVNEHAGRRIASLLELKPGEAVLEIGGGRGDLTHHLLATGADVTSVEIDRSLVALLHERFRNAANLRVIGKNILDLEPHTVFADESRVKLVGNIPYNLTAPIIEWIVENRDAFYCVVLMVQKEVATRMAAKPGRKDYGSLTVFVQLFYNVAKAFDLRPGSFYPPPKVSSSVIRLSRLDKSLIDEEEYADLRRLTSACFRWRRKQIVRILREEYLMPQQSAQQLLDLFAIPYAARPEQLAVTDFVALARRLRCVELGSS